MPTPSPLLPVLLLQEDRLYADLLRQLIERALPIPKVTVVHTVTAAKRSLASEPFDLLVAGLGATDSLEFVAHCALNPMPAPRVLAVVTRREYRTLVALRDMPLPGVFDSTSEPSAAFAQALQAVASGIRHWSPGIVRQMDEVAAAPQALFRLLTDLEQVVLSVIGDGSDDAVAARQLNLSPATISTVRRSLHRKLGLKHRGELIRLAAQTGYVRFTSTGVERPGFSLLAATYHPRRHRAPGDPRRHPVLAN